MKLKEELTKLKQERTLAEREVEHQRALLVAENSKGAEMRQKIQEKEDEKIKETQKMLEDERKRLNEERSSICLLYTSDAADE